MSEAHELPPRDHNRPPEMITPPTETSLLADLEARYPQVKKDLDELVKAAGTFPAEIKDDETAGALQALIKKMTTHAAAWKAWRGVEKKPWDTAAKVVQNFFGKPEETLVDKEIGWVAKLRPRHTKYLEWKDEQERQRREEQARQEREAAEELRMDQLWAEARAELAEYDAQKAYEREQEALRRAEDAKWDAIWAEARAELAAWEEAAAEARRKAREEEEKRQRRVDKATLTRLTREANKLGEKDQAGTLTDDDRDRYRQLIGTNGEIPMLQRRLEDATAFLSDEEKAELIAEEENLARLRAERIKNHEAAEAAKAAQAAAKADSRGARADQREAVSEQRQATREATSKGRVADKTEARAGRIETKLEDASTADLSRTRGDYGTVGSLSGRWTHRIADFDALFAPQGTAPIFKLIPHLSEEDLNGAVFRFMRQNQAQWDARKTPLIRDLLPGVVFEFVPESRIV